MIFCMVWYALSNVNYSKYSVDHYFSYVVDSCLKSESFGGPGNWGKETTCSRAWGYFKSYGTSNFHGESRLKMRMLYYRGKEWKT